jgi:hypothetical protein
MNTKQLAIIGASVGLAAKFYLGQGNKAAVTIAVIAVIAAGLSDNLVTA